VIVAQESSLLMQFLLYAVIVLHVIVCFFLIGVVLLQQGKSADLAGTFGGQGSQTAFGPRAAANLLTKMTSWAAAVFMITSLSLTILYLRTSGASHSVFSGVKGSAPVSAPAKPGK
jgi:preprotein translocase subunit SecG